MSAAEALREPMGGGMLPEGRQDYDRLVEALQASLGAEAFAAAWADGHALDMNAAVDYALSAP